jgi:signal transduction histidine kinase
MFLLTPDNFIYFIVLFTLSIIGGINELLSYKKSWLNYINSVIFFHCASIISIEYYNSYIETYESADYIFTFYGPISLNLILLIWLCLLYQIKPFSNRIKSNKYYHLFAALVLIIPTFFNIFQLFMRWTFELTPEKLDGYWAFRILDNWIVSFYIFQTYIFGFFFTSALFTYAIIKNKRNRKRKTMLALLFMIFPIIYHAFIVNSDPMNWTVPNVGLPILCQVYLLTWFLSDYRLFDDGFENASSDFLNSISDLSIQTDNDLLIRKTNLKLNSFFDVPDNYISIFITENSYYSRIETKRLLNNLITKNVKSEELLLIDKNEVERQFRIQVSKLCWKGKDRGYTFLLSDLSEIKIKEKELAKLNDTKDRIFAIIGHDLRKPAVSFRSISKKVKYLIEKQDFETLDKYGQQIEQNALSLNKLTNNLLNWALVQRNVMPYNPIKVSISDIVMDTIVIFETPAKEKSINIVNQIPSQVSVYVDSNALSTILTNLVDNAIKYTPIGGQIKIDSLEESNNQVKIRVSDTGVGMDRDKVDNLFLLTKNKSEQGTNGEKGTGLGLHLVKELVELNKGGISAISNIGKGTSIEVILPNL